MRIATIKKKVFSLTEIYTDEIEKTLKEFEIFFNIKTKWSYGGNITGYFNNIEDDILELKGIILLKYLQNNYDFFKGNYFSLWSKKEKSFVLKSKYSGVCFDDDILKPIYDFLKNPCECTTFEGLLNKCLNSWINIAIKDYEYKTSLARI